MSGGSNTYVVAEDTVGRNGSIGAPSPSERHVSEWRTIRVTFQNFADMDQKRGVGVKSRAMQCHGYDWVVQLCPKGDSVSSEDIEHISVILCCKPKDNTDGDDVLLTRANYRVRVPSANHTGISSRIRDFLSSGPNGSWGFKDFIRRSSVLNPANNFLVNGDLIIEVDIQVELKDPPGWVPSSTLSVDMLKMLDEAADDETSDALFAVGQDSDDEKECTKQQFNVHKNILKARSPFLAALVEDYGENTPIPIDDVDPAIFQMLLRFIYGGEVPAKEILKEKCRTIISAADRFGCTGLKLAAEAELVSNKDAITVENDAELILFADGSNCALLKEAAMDFFLENSEAVMQSDGYEKVKESPLILNEMVMALVSKSKKRPAPVDPDGRDYKRMRVATLRQKLDDKGLDVDGSKEMLAARLEEAVAAEKAETAAAAAAADAATAENESSDSDEDEDE